MMVVVMVVGDSHPFSGQMLAKIFIIIQNELKRRPRLTTVLSSGRDNQISIIVDLQYL